MRLKKVIDEELAIDQSSFYSGNLPVFAGENVKFVHLTGTISVVTDKRISQNSAGILFLPIKVGI